MKLRHAILTILFSTALSGCASLSNVAHSSTTTLSGADYTALANSASGLTQQEYWLQAAQSYVNNHQYVLANKSLSNIDISLLNPTQLQQKALLLAQILLEKRQFNAAIQQLERNKKNITPEQNILWYRLTANASAGLNLVPQTINLRTTLATLLQNNTPANQTNCQQIWTLLQKQSDNTLNQLLAQQPAAAVTGWIQLAQILRRNDLNPTQLYNALTTWRSDHPTHLANVLFPTNLQEGRINTSKIALLLPLSGPYANSGKAVRNGFFSAYFYWKRRLNPAPSVSVIDTAKETSSQAYQDALQQGATLVVGPLIKNNISNLISNNTLSIPMIALNTVQDTDSTQNNLFQFGLNPADEVTQLVSKAWQDQHSRAVVIADSSPWGQNLVQLLQTQWQQRGGTIVDTLNIDATKNLSTQIQQVLHINEARSRAFALRQLINAKFRYQPRQRKDFNAIFFIGNSTEAKQVRPLLKYFYVGDIPVYAISPVYAGFPNRRRDRDLNGIFFCDIPWVISANSLRPSFLQSIRNSTIRLWGKDARVHAKLYALGVDAFNTSLNLNKMLTLPLFSVKSATGNLYLQPNQQIYRQLDWAKFDRGVAKKISS